MAMLQLNNKIYTKEAVLKAVYDFTGLCTIKFDEVEKYYQLEFEDCKCGEERTMKEFENYVVGIENL